MRCLSDCCLGDCVVVTDAIVGGGLTGIPLSARCGVRGVRGEIEGRGEWERTREVLLLLIIELVYTIYIVFVVLFSSFSVNRVHVRTFFHVPHHCSESRTHLTILEC